MPQYISDLASRSPSLAPSSIGIVRMSAKESPVASPPNRKGKLLRRSNSDRLRMHAPSSIEVSAPAPALGGWKMAIPLLSPLEFDLRPWHQQPESSKAPREEVADATTAEQRQEKWEHPAAPFYYEPVPSNATPFVSS